MTTIDEIRETIEHFGEMAHKAMGELAEQEDFDEREGVKTDLRALVTQAIAEARAAGARDMREAAAKEFDRRDGGTGIGFYDPHEPAEIIRAMPLPDKREVVRLTAAEIAKAMLSEAPDEFRSHGDEDELAASAGYVAIGRAIETAVLAANGMTK